MTWSNQSRNSAAWSNASHSDLTIFDNIPLSVIEANTFDGMFMGKKLDDWRFNDVVGTIWTNQVRN